MSTRSFVLQLGNQEALVLSPIAFSEGELEEIAAVGPVTHLVAPNLFHHLWLADAQERWPNATVWGPDGLETKSEAITDYRRLSARPEAPWPKDLQCVEVRGMPRFREWALFHAGSRTLFVTDLVFNQPTAHTATTRFFLRMTGVYGKCAVSRLFRGMIRDKEAFAESCRAILALPFERVVMAHGETIELNAKATLTKALARWV